MVLVGVLFFSLIAAILLLGVGSYAVSHHARVLADAKYAAALDMAEAGIDYEFYRLTTLGPTYADPYPTGATYTCPTTVKVGDTSYTGTFNVYCKDASSAATWDTTTGFLVVVSKGTVDGVSRTIQASAKGFDVPGKYAIYTMDSISIWRGSSMDITGDVGSNGNLDFTSHPGISGSVYFNGPAAGWWGNTPSGYNVVRSPRAVTWPTVDQLAAQKRTGGLAGLAISNDNAKANPPIINNTISDSKTLTAGDYYITNMNLTGNKKITLDNTNGPVNIWIGPANGTGTARFRGGTAAIPVSSDPSKASHIYVGTASGIDLAGNETIDALVYAYNKDAAGNPYGYVQNSGNPTLNGQIIANKVDINGNISINYATDLIKPTSYGYYGFNNSWTEVNPR